MTPQEFQLEMSRLIKEFERPGKDKVYTEGKLRLLYETVKLLDSRTLSLGIDQMILDYPVSRPPLGPEFREIFGTALDRVKSMNTIPKRVEYVDQPGNEKIRSYVNGIIEKITKPVPRGDE